ncbi:hypothetical protein [Sinorhizobium arboris]|uniref:hypothetical protein n=1 Tax=Sinorhizobium arboris TaxID=76745 RepID=UPI0003F64A7F|nr:hypothetical protein [Sinorhizobium arboris]
MLTNYFWLFVTGGGAFILGAAVAYAILKQRPLSRAERQAQKQKVEELYEQSSENRPR